MGGVLNIVLGIPSTTVSNIGFASRTSRRLPPGLMSAFVIMSVTSSRVEISFQDKQAVVIVRDRSWDKATLGMASVLGTPKPTVTTSNSIKLDRTCSFDKLSRIFVMRTRGVFSRRQIRR
jgi:hypothetical protein